MTEYEHTSLPTVVDARPIGSPRWLCIVRDVLISLVMLLILVGSVLIGVAYARDGDPLDGIGDDFGTSSTDVPVDPNDPNNVYNIPGTDEYCSIHPDSAAC